MRSNLKAAQRRRARGVTLIEVLVVVAIMALIAGSVGVAVFKHWSDAQIQTTATNARSIRKAVEAWWLNHDAAVCPGVDELVASGVVDRDSPRLDAWGESWRVECSEGQVSVLSAGRDRRHGTDDDIRIPPV